MAEADNRACWDEVLNKKDRYIGDHFVFEKPNHPGEYLSAALLTIELVGDTINFTYAPKGSPGERRTASMSYSKTTPTIFRPPLGDGVSFQDTNSRRYQVWNKAFMV